MGVELLTSKAILGMYYRTLDEVQAPAWVSNLALPVTSDQYSENHVWLDMPAPMRKWVGGRQVNTFKSNSQIIVNDPWESTIEFDRMDRKLDKTGQIEGRIRNHVKKGVVQPAILLSDLIKTGKSAACYDGQFFFDTDHAEGASGTQSNDLSFACATGTTPTAAEMSDAIMQAVAAIYGFKDDKGEPLNEDVTEFDVMVPPSLWDKAIAAVKNDYVNNGVTNTLKNAELTIRPVVNPRLTDATEFYVFAVDGPKPFILQELDPLRVSAKAEGSEYEHDTDKHQFGISWQGGVGYGFWQGAVLTTLT